MKKIIFRLFIVLIVLCLVAVVAVHLYLDVAVKKAVEKYGPELTKVEVKLGTINLSLLSGSGKISKFKLGNPEGYKSPSAMVVETGSIAIEPRSLLSDKVVFHSINFQAPEVTFETDLLQNNLGKILANLDETTGGGSQPKSPSEPKPSKKLQVDEFVLSGGKIHVVVNAFGGKSANVPLPEIRLKDLGQGPEGITPAELTRTVLKSLIASATTAAATAIADLSKGGVFLSSPIGAGQTNTNKLENITRGIGDLFKKKE